MTKVGVIGLGTIGGGIARGVHRGGHELVVCDVRDEAVGALADVSEPAANPGELASCVDVIVVAVIDDDQVRSVLLDHDGALRAAAPGTTVILVSTVSIPTLEAVAGEAGVRGVDVVDCGVTGGPGAAAQSALVSMVGGDPAVVDRVRPVLDSFSSHVFHMGPVGAGLQAKLARNLVQYGAWMACFEGSLLAQAAGIPLTKLAEVIRAGDAMTGGVTAFMTSDTVAPLPPDTDPAFVALLQGAAALAHKDLEAALALGGTLGVALPQAEVTNRRFDHVMGLGDPDKEPA